MDRRTAWNQYISLLAYTPSLMVWHGKIIQPNGLIWSVRQIDGQDHPTIHTSIVLLLLYMRATNILIMTCLWTSYLVVSWEFSQSVDPFLLHFEHDTDSIQNLLPACQKWPTGFRTVPEVPEPATKTISNVRFGIISWKFVLLVVLVQWSAIPPRSSKTWKNMAKVDLASC